MALAQPQLGRVLDRHDPLLTGDGARERAQGHRLARAGSAAHEDRGPRCHRQREQVGRLGGERAVPGQIAKGEPLSAKAADRQARADERERRDHHVHP
jgi:hypothetical protein